MMGSLRRVRFHRLSSFKSAQLARMARAEKIVRRVCRSLRGVVNSQAQAF
jgi:hypothetical protein